MKSLHGIQHGGLRIRFHGLPNFSSSLPPRGGPDASFGRPLIFFIFQQDKFHGRFQNRFHDSQTPPSSSLKLVDFETYYIEPNPPLFFCQQNMQWSRNMVHSHLTLCLRVRDYLNRLSQHPRYGFWMRVKGPPLQGHGSWLVCEVALSHSLYAYLI